MTIGSVIAFLLFVAIAYFGYTFYKKQTAKDSSTPVSKAPSDNTKV